MDNLTLEFDKLASIDPKIKYGFVKEILKTGKENPGLLYEHYDYWVKLLDDKNNIIKWAAIDIIGYLSSVDKENKTEKKIPALFKLLHGGRLITSAHAIFALGLIAQNKEKQKAKIIKELLSVSHDKFETTECKNIITGKVLDVLKLFPTDIQKNETAIDFIKKAVKNRRNATKKRAEQLLKKIGKEKG
ncbi:MAG: hypothetical protein A2V93_09310 [Ignavibacteria bacterium RBG_16_34_14]|nr:MAG: hypothetical protein A2V93_09310 [Ignavibacteria bacterium RBG_16_34_14]